MTSSDTGSGSHASRYAALARLLARHGRSDLVSGSGLDDFSLESADESTATGDTDRAAQFAADLERMGPTYIKLGQVHRALTRSGRDVVVKVQRPGVGEVIAEDMAVLERLARLADEHTGVGERIGFARLLAQFRRSLAGELDYRREARNLVRFRELTREYDHIVVPEPLWDYTRARVLTMEFVEGRKVTDVGPLGLLDVDTHALVDELFACYLRMILDGGVLHVDPHPGNLLLTSDGRIALLDLGMVATIPPRIQSRVVKLMIAISDGDGEEVAEVLASMGHPLPGYDAATFREDVALLVSSALELGPDLQAGSVLLELSRVSGSHGLRPPAEMAMIGKALLNLDQVTLHLDPTFAPAEAIRNNAGQIMRGGLAVSPGGLMAAAIEAKEFTSQLPRRANRILDALSEGELTVRVNAIDEGRLVTVLQRLANRLTLGLVLAATIVGAALMMQVPTRARILGYPSIAMAFFLVAALGGGLLVAWIVITDRRISQQAKREELMRR